MLDTAAPAIAQHAPIEKDPDAGHSLAAGYHSEQVTAGDKLTDNTVADQGNEKKVNE